MKVKELIEALKQYPDDLEVVIESPYESDSHHESVQWTQRGFHNMERFGCPREGILIR